MKKLEQDCEGNYICRANNDFVCPDDAAQGFPYCGDCPVQKAVDGRLPAEPDDL